MRITIKHKDTEVILEDPSKEPSSIRWKDQNKQIQETLLVAIEGILKLTTIK